jgi:exodeoxyribonuclease V alpha subunit
MSAPTAEPRLLARDDVRVSVAAPPALRGFVEAGLLVPADVHAARTFARLGGEDRDEVLLAAALAVRAPRLGHVCIDLATAATSVVADGDVAPALLDQLRWPEPGAWTAAVADGPLVRRAEDPDAGIRPLVLDGTRLYLDRYWRYERRVVHELGARAVAEVAHVDLAAVRAGLDRLLPPPAADEPAAPPRPPRVALAAPTGKAAARLTSSLHEAAGRLTVDADVQAALRAAEASTLHRLLGWAPGVRFRHDRDDPLPHDVVVVDETSMVSLSLVARLLDAVRRDSRVVLLGDPHQLASVEAGTVLGDVVGPADVRLWSRPEAIDRLAQATGEQQETLSSITVPTSQLPSTPIGETIVVLQRVRRFAETSGIAALAAAIHSGEPAATIEVLHAGGADGSRDVTWVETDDAAGFDELARVREPVVEAGRDLVGAAHAGDAELALTVVDRVRVLCAHRRGPYGVADWNPRVERWLVRAGVELDLARRWYIGRPVIVGRNDHRLGVFNGDVGVTLAHDHGAAVAFEGADGARRIHPGRLEAVDTVHAMTIHRSQGSQFEHVVVVLPHAGSPILTRELLYTAVTRATARVTVVGSRAAIEAAVSRPIARASGLRGALWGDAGAR